MRNKNLPSNDLQRVSDLEIYWNIILFFVRNRESMKVKNKTWIFCCGFISFFWGFFVLKPQLTSSSDENSEDETSKHAFDGIKNVKVDKRNDELGNEVQHKRIVEIEMNSFDEQLSAFNEENCELLTGESEAMSILNFAKTSEEKISKVNEMNTITVTEATKEQKPLIEVLNINEQENNLPNINNKEYEIISSLNNEHYIEMEGNTLDDKNLLEVNVEQFEKKTTTQNARGIAIKFYCENLDTFKNMNIDGNTINETESDAESFTEEIMPLNK